MRESSVKMLNQKSRNLVCIFSLLVLAGCGNFSPSGFSVLEQQQAINESSPESIPANDLGASLYEDFSVDLKREQAFEESLNSDGTVVEDSDPKIPETKSSDAKPPETKPPEAKPTVPKTNEPAKVEHKVAETGVVKPTVYYFPVFNEDKQLCDKDDVKTLHGVNGEKIVNVCPSTLASCGLQGSCAIIQNGVRRSFNISDRIKGQDRYFEMTNTECRFGYGVRSACLDPFYTVAADLDYYKPGDVIFVPAVVGLKLPDGSAHNGYFIVRDQGRGINGKDRFDFYSGFVSWRDERNPFRKLHFEDIKTQVPYAKIIGVKAEQVLKSRSYPKLPPPRQK